MSQVVHTVCETQAFHLSSQTRSPAYERQREPWASAPAPPSGIPPASLRQLRNRPKRESRTSTCKQPSSCIKSTHLPESSVKHTVWTTASQSSFLVPVGQEISLLTDTYREIRMSGYLKKSLKKTPWWDQSYFHVVGLTGDFSGRPWKQGRTGVVQSIGGHFFFVSRNQVEVECKLFVILKKPIKVILSGFEFQWAIEI